MMSENLGKHGREWPAGKASAKVQMFVEANSKPHGIVIYTDGSISRDRSGWRFTVKQGGMSVHRYSGAHKSHNLQSDHRDRSSHTCYTVASLTKRLADYTCHHSQTEWTCCKVESGMGFPSTSMHNLRLQRQSLVLPTHLPPGQEPTQMGQQKRQQKWRR